MRIVSSIYSILLLCVILITPLFLCGQGIEEEEDYFVFNRGINDGLSQNMLISIAKDHHGFLWLGTLDGVNLFDGRNFVELGQYNQIKGPNNDYYQIVPTYDNQVYTHRADGILKFDFSNFEWTQDSLLKESQFVFQLEDRRNIVYSNGTLFNLEGDNTNPSIENNCDIPTDLRIVAVSENVKTEEIFVLSSRGLMISYDSKSLECIGKKDLSRKDVEFLDLVSFQERLFIIGGYGTFLEWDLQTRILHDKSALFESYPVENFTDLHRHEDVIYLTADRVGLFEYTISEDKWTHKMVRLVDNPQIEHEYLIKVFKVDDKIYFGSASGGLLVYDPNQINFYRIPEIDFYESTIYDLKLPRNIAEDKYGNKWICTTGQGLWKYNPSENKTYHYTVETHPQLLRSNAVRLIRFIDDELWIGYIGKGIDIADPIGLTVIKRNILKNEGFSENKIVNDIYVDKEHDIWLATETQGIFILTEDIVTHLHEENSPLKSNRVYNIKEIGSSLIFANFNGIVYEADTDNNQVKVKKTGLTENEYSIKCLEEDLYGNIWIGSGGQGVIILDSLWNPIDTLSIESGDLLSDELCIIQRDQNDQMWVASNKGLVHFSCKNGKVKKERTYLQKDGLQSNEFMTDSYLFDRDQNIWMGTIKGINHWNPSRMDHSDEQMEVYLRTAKFDETILERQLCGDHLGSHEKELKNVNFSFSTIGFTAENNIEYMLKLEGYDESWRKLGTRNFISFSNLPVGKYSLQIMSTNYDGVWSDEVHEWPFSVEPSITDLWWFYVLMLIGIAVMALYMLKLYSDFQVKRELKKTEIEREKVEMEMRALKAQINPHFLFNTLSSINNFILKNEKNIASQYLVKFSRLIRKILNYNSKRLINLNEELEALELYINLEQMRLGDSFDYFININLDRALSEVYIPPLIVQPLVENAIWHGLMHKKGNQILTINIDQKDQFLDISIEDNGIGRKAAAKMDSPEKSRSYGMEITKRRLALWMSPKEFEQKEWIEFEDLESDQGEAVGTSVHVLIPLNLLEQLKEERN